MSPALRVQMSAEEEWRLQVARSGADHGARLPAAAESLTVDQTGLPVVRASSALGSLAARCPRARLPSLLQGTAGRAQVVLAGVQPLPKRFAELGGHTGPGASIVSGLFCKHRKLKWQRNLWAEGLGHNALAALQRPIVRLSAHNARQAGIR